jgi:hypothetical protein
VDFRLAFFFLPCVFVLCRVLIVFSGVLFYMVSEPDSSLLLGRAVLGYSYHGWWLVYCLALSDSRNILSWVSVCCVL